MLQLQKYGYYMAEYLKLKNKGKDYKSSSSFVAGDIEEKSDGIEMVLQFLFQMFNFISGSLIMLVHFICTLKKLVYYLWVNQWCFSLDKEWCSLQDYCFVGIGIVKIRIYDGIVRDLRNVWHIPDWRLTKFLWAFWILLVASILAKIDSLEFVKALSLWWKVIRLMASTFFRAILKQVQLMSSKDELDIARLSHMQLGHMSEGIW